MKTKIYLNLTKRIIKNGKNEMDLYFQNVYFAKITKYFKRMLWSTYFNYDVLESIL